MALTWSVERSLLLPLDPQLMIGTNNKAQKIDSNLFINHLPSSNTSLKLHYITKIDFVK
jgi:hypothetical protein